MPRENEVDGKPALVISGLRFRYGSHARPTLHAHTDGEAWLIDVPSLTLSAGEQMLITGGSGCGKSTLLQLIAGLLDPQHGSIEVGGCRMHGRRGAQRDLLRGRLIGMIFQTFNLLHGFSAVENVMAALMFADPRRFPPRTHRSRAEQLLDSLGLKQFDAKPERLSVGQQQRVAVARAIACEPALVLADEPTASLDPSNATAAMNLIQQTCREHNAALLCVSHDPAMVERFGRQRELCKTPLQDAAV